MRHLNQQKLDAIQLMKFKLKKPGPFMSDKDEQEIFMMLLILVEIFSIFDIKNGSTIKKLQKLLKKNKETPFPFDRWLAEIESLKDLRHKIFVHKDLNPNINSVNHQKILDLLQDFEQKLLDVDQFYGISNSTNSKIVSTLDLNIPILSQLQSVLINDSAEST